MSQEISRRNLFKGALVAVATAVLPRSMAQASGLVSKADAFAVLVDLTRCIGCRSCMRGCQRANDLTAPQELMDLDHLSTRLSPDFRQWTVVNTEGSGSTLRHVKRQCMHCLEPACVSVCPVAALDQTEQGPVIYRESRCIGCRYCMMACPFDVPRFEWNNGLTPVIGKCQFCAQERLFKGLLPGCVESCPTGALKFGKREDILFEAKARIRSRPDFYMDHVFGEEEVGGTSWLYLSDVPFDQLGFKKNLSKRPLPSLTWDVVSLIPGIAAVLASLFGVLAHSLSRKNGHGKGQGN
ncbi:MAG TPA: 4Fe-4S dicluster domain-containing protein [Elusimicrobiota bacterium]|nr:4Fe-4S dicluster domain-containing protein [Elusimicrobiota bacterium]